ncbi:hypothetical protein MAR_024174 [Mya arenaria]|uniref:Uncharacterized protein n=1 Tax=Mya arenaria TaxID=6604 RepID=A0ABY7DT70_MYAAR|nr:hypothetical protein MAR_024174 [Mya arenaria]
MTPFANFRYCIFSVAVISLRLRYSKESKQYWQASVIQYSIAVRILYGTFVVFFVYDIVLNLGFVVVEDAKADIMITGLKYTAGSLPGKRRKTQSSTQNDAEKKAKRQKYEKEIRERAFKPSWKSSSTRPRRPTLTRRKGIKLAQAEGGNKPVGVEIIDEVEEEEEEEEKEVGEEEAKQTEGEDKQEVGVDLDAARPSGTPMAEDFDNDSAYDSYEDIEMNEKNILRFACGNTLSNCNTE